MSWPPVRSLRQNRRGRLPPPEVALFSDLSSRTSVIPVQTVARPKRIMVSRLAVREVSRSGKPAELLVRYGISAAHIAATVRGFVGAVAPAVASA